MKKRIRRFINEAFREVPETRELVELKEEMISNLIESTHDFRRSGLREEEAYDKSISGLGDLSELVETLRHASQEKKGAPPLQSVRMDRIHIVGYTVSTVFVVFGFMMAIFSIFLFDDYRLLLDLIFGTLIFSSVVYTLLGLTQETRIYLPMGFGRALAYACAAGLTLSGIFLPLLIHLYDGSALWVISSIAVSVIPSVGVFCYLGLTERSRSKLSPGSENWKEQWVSYYQYEKQDETMGLISGALWIFTTALFLLGILSGYPNSWILFIFAAGIQVLLIAIFKHRS